MEVIILAGGLGTRLKSTIGNEIPKCMAPVNGKPFLWYLLKYLTQMPVTKVILSVGHLRDVIFKWIDEIKDTLPYIIDYAVEETPLGTGGGIKLAMSKCTEPIVYVLNGDTMFDVDLVALGTRLTENRALIEIALKPMYDFDRYGSVSVGENGQIIKFNEKAHCDKGLINGGVYAIDKNWFNYLCLPQKFSFEKDVLEVQCLHNKLFGMVSDGYFIDIGIPEDYNKANEDFKTLFA